MNEILIGNILVLIAQISTIYISTRRDREKILYAQFFPMTLLTVSSFLLKGYSAVAIDLIEIFRNIVILKDIKIKYREYLFMAATIILGTYFNNRGLLGLLPVVANLLQTYVLMNKNISMKYLKLTFALSFLCWTIYNFVISSYVGVVFNFINVLVNLYEAFRK